jgi:hypothetical protein
MTCPSKAIGQIVWQVLHLTGLWLALDLSQKRYQIPYIGSLLLQVLMEKNQRILS